MIRSFYFTYFLFLFPVVTHAQNGLIITLDSVADRVRHQNLELKAARLSIREALGRMAQAGKPSRPRLDIEWESDGRVRERNYSIGMSASFPVTKKLQAEKNISRAAYEAAECEVRVVEQSMIAQARASCVKALALQAQSRLLQEQKSEADELAMQLKTIAAKGEGNPLDAGQAALEASAIIIETQQLAAQLTAQKTEIKKLLDMPATQEIIISGELPSVAPPPHVPVQSLPAYQLLLKEVKTSRQEIVLEKMNRYDDLEAGVFLSGMRREDVPEGYKSDLMLGLRFSIPLPFWNDNQGAIQAAEAKSLRSEQEARAKARDMEHEIAGANAEMKQWASLENDLITKLIPQATAQCNAALEAKKKGQGDLNTLFLARAQRRKLMTAQVQARAEYNIAKIKQQNGGN